MSIKMVVYNTFTINTNIICLFDNIFKLVLYYNFYKLL